MPVVRSPPFPDRTTSAIPGEEPAQGASSFATSTHLLCGKLILSQVTPAHVAHTLLS